MKSLLFALALAAAPVHAQSVDAPQPEAAPATTSAPAPAATVAAEDKKVCKLERELGSNRAKRVCRTRAEMDAESEAARAGLSNAQRGH